MNKVGHKHHSGMKYRMPDGVFYLHEVSNLEGRINNQEAESTTRRQNKQMVRSASKQTAK
jgi:hypothetical protein